MVSVGSFLEEDGEDPETKRRRREAEQNGADLGAAIGLAISLIGLAADAYREEQKAQGTAEKLTEKPTECDDPAQTLGGM